MPIVLWHGNNELSSTLFEKLLAAIRNIDLFSMKNEDDIVDAPPVLQKDTIKQLLACFDPSDIDCVVDLNIFNADLISAVMKTDDDKLKFIALNCRQMSQQAMRDKVSAITNALEERFGNDDLNDLMRRIQVASKKVGHGKVVFTTTSKRKRRASNAVAENSGESEIERPSKKAKKNVSEEEGDDE